MPISEYQRNRIKVRESQRQSRKGVRIDALLHWEIKCASAAEGVAIGDWMDQALREVLAARRKKAKTVRARAAFEE